MAVAWPETTPAPMEDTISEPANQAKPWYAVQTRRNHELIVRRGLEEKGYETLLPLQRVRRAWADRVKFLEEPLFPGYVFCRLDITRRLPVLQTPGVTRFVGLGKTPAQVDAAEMEALVAVVASGLPLEPAKPAVGQTVRILNGPLRGMTGTVIDVNDERRLVVSVSLLQQAAAVVIDHLEVELAA